MPFLLIPLVLIVVGVLLIVLFALGFALLRLLFWPALIILGIWWLTTRRQPGPTRPQTDWQDHLRVRKTARNAREETRPNDWPTGDAGSSATPHDDDWSDF